jgi:hypothetical protein
LLAGSDHLAAQHGFPHPAGCSQLRHRAVADTAAMDQPQGVRQQWKQASQGFETQISQIS